MKGLILRWGGYGCWVLWVGLGVVLTTIDGKKFFQFKFSPVTNCLFVADVRVKARNVEVSIPVLISLRRSKAIRGTWKLYEILHKEAHFTSRAQWTFSNVQLLAGLILEILKKNQMAIIVIYLLGTGYLTEY